MAIVRRTALPGALLGLALALLAVPAGAQEADAESRFAAARKLYDGGDHAGAYKQFQALAAETGSPNAELYAAWCLRELGRLPEAYEAAVLALRHATAKAENDDKYAKTRTAAAAEVARLEAKVARLTVAVADPPPGVAVTVNGAAFPGDKLGVPVAAAAGPALVLVRAPGRREVERRVELRAGEATTVTVALEAAGERAQAPATTGGGARIAGFALAGAGLGGVVTFAVAGALVDQRYGSLFVKCGGTNCKHAGAAGEIEGGKALQLAANIGLGIGIAGAVGGALLIAFGGPVAAKPAASLWLAPGLGGFSAGGVF